MKTINYIKSWFDQYSFIRTGFILSVACLAALSYNAYRTDGLPLVYREITLDQHSHLTLEQAYLLYRQGNVVFIDTRYQDEYNSGHIRSAINLPSRASVDEMMRFLAMLDKKETVVVYCASIRCNSADRLAGFMKHIGFTGIYVFPEGIEVWKKNNLPITKNHGP